MIRKIIFLCLISLAFFSFANAQEGSEEAPRPLVELPKLEAKIKAEDFVRINKKIIFDATDSILTTDIAKAQYFWDFGDGIKDFGEEVVHQYKSTGSYNVTLKITKGREESLVEKQIFVFDKKALLITDSEKEEEINLITNQAESAGVALQVFSPLKDEAGFLTEDRLKLAIADKSEYIKYLIF